VSLEDKRCRGATGMTRVHDEGALETHVEHC